ncbi:MAG: serine hydrolase domain-containing protein [Planctomycetota bacterium]
MFRSKFFYNTYRWLPFKSPKRATPWAFAVVVAALLTTAALGETPAFDLDQPEAALETIRRQHDLPAIGAAVVTADGLQALATAGVRKRGEAVAVTDDDLWHLGSCGKAMTATLIARLVEAGQLRFEQTLGESFPELAPEMDEALRSVTLLDLLSHRSGLPANFNLLAYANQTDAHQARQQVLRETLKQPLLSPPGEAYLYSNWGYTLAGHIAEQAVGEPWETLMQREVFEPLGITSAGFGGLGTPGKIDQPWPHTPNGTPWHTTGPEIDNVPAMGPAGRIHMNLADWAKFTAEHLKGRRGESDFLNQESFRLLHTARGDDYALGWVVASRPWAGGDALNHVGDNTLNHANAWLAPEKGFAVLIVTNQSTAYAATDQVASGLILAWLAQDP